jgi:hypothetical protein
MECACVWVGYVWGVDFRCSRPNFFEQVVVCGLCFFFFFLLVSKALIVLIVLEEEAAGGFHFKKNDSLRRVIHPGCTLLW